MASNNALTLSASPLVSNKATSSPLSAGFSPKSVSFKFLPPTTTHTSRPSLVMRAENEDTAGTDSGASGNMQRASEMLQSDSWRHRPAFLNVPPQVRTPWNHYDDQNEVLMSYDMPGLSATDLQVTRAGDLLEIRVKEGELKKDLLGRDIGSTYDTVLQLPISCDVEKLTAECKNGVLYIRAPKGSSERKNRINIPVVAS